MKANGKNRNKSDNGTERRKLILQAARSLFLKHGYHGTSLRQIAKEIKLTTGAIYFYFENKDEIYGEICIEAFNLLIEYFQKAIANIKDPQDKLNALGKAYYKFYSDHNGYYRLITQQDAGFKTVGFSSLTRFCLTRRSIRALMIIKRVFIEGYKLGFFKDIDRWELTLTALASMEGLLALDSRGVLQQVNSNLDKIYPKFLEIFLSGIRK